MSVATADEIYTFVKGFEQTFEVTCVPNVSFGWFNNSFYYDRTALASRDLPRAQALFLRNWLRSKIEHDLDIPKIALRLRSRLRRMRLPKPTLLQTLAIMAACIDAWTLDQFKKNKRADGYSKLLPTPFTGPRQDCDFVTLATAITNEPSLHWDRLTLIIGAAANGTVPLHRMLALNKQTLQTITMIREKITSAATVDNLIENLFLILPAIIGRQGRTQQLARLKIATTGLLVEFNTGDAWLADREPTITVPSWAQLRDTLAPLITPIREMVRRNLLDNVPDDRERGRTGRVDGRTLVRSSLGSLNAFSKRTRKNKPEYGVIVLLDVSTSMTIINENYLSDDTIFGGIVNNYPVCARRQDVLRSAMTGSDSWVRYHQHSLFGIDTPKFGATWHLAYKTLVLLSASFARVESIDFGIFSFSDHTECLKPIGNGLRQNDQNAIMSAFVAGGSKTLVRDALDAAHRALAHYEYRLIIVLSDGAFSDAQQKAGDPLDCIAPPDLRGHMQSIVADHTNLVVVGLGSDCGSVYVPTGHFSLVHNETDVQHVIAATLKKRIKRQAVDRRELFG